MTTQTSPLSAQEIEQMIAFEQACEKVEAEASTVDRSGWAKPESWIPVGTFASNADPLYRLTAQQYVGDGWCVRAAYSRGSMLVLFARSIEEG